MIATKLWWQDGAEASVSGGELTHVFAAGADIPEALRLATEHPDTVLSLILAEPLPLDGDAVALLTQVGVPTLVLAAAPEAADTDLSVAQQIAGDVENAVFVVIDDAPRPVQTSSPESFAEWSSSFVAIAEGLAIRDGRPLTPATPLIEGEVT